MKKHSRIGLLAGLTLFAFQAHAESLVDGDAEAGKSKALVCTACHGAEGNSVMPQWPNLAGQSANYTAAQLKAFQAGTRSDPVMSAQAAGLSETDINDLAVYYESLPAAAQTVADANLVNRAESLYRGGNADEGIAACIACHGPTGRGNPAAAYPSISGQHAAYTAKQLRDYASGARESDGPTGVMRDVASRLDQDDIQALASYVQGLK